MEQRKFIFLFWMASFLLLIPFVFAQSFVVDYENNCFLKDGEPFRYASGSIHYFRVLPHYWHDRIYKMKMAGLNAIQTYVEWNSHEPQQGSFNFKKELDLSKFLSTAMNLDMLVILRIGPFIDAERDMGGLPFWLLQKNPDIKLRTYDPTYIKYVDRWYSVLLPMIEPYLYSNGGPIIMIQIENEYGSVGCDAQYKSHLRDLVRSYFQDRVVLFTTDGGNNQVLTCGKTDQVLSTIDFGPGSNVSSMFELLRWHQASGPLVVSEFYSGWLDHWGQAHANVSSELIAKTLTEILAANASVNIYMFHGGTSFGFGSGSNLGGSFHACPTSYDYDAPLDEAGDPTPKYYHLRQVIGKFLPLPPGPVPKPSPKLEFGPIKMQLDKSKLWNHMAGPLKQSYYPVSYEDMGQFSGLMLYKTVIPFLPSDPSVLTVPELADRGYVYVDKVFQGILSREQKAFSLPIQARKGASLYIMVESQGRICSGENINDRKGIFRNVTLGSKTLVNWEIRPLLNLEAKNRNGNASQNAVKFDKKIFEAKFMLESNKIYDTYLRLDGWHKGIVMINGFNVGRYWPVVGPQVTLYIPGVLFNKPPQNNSIWLLELEQDPCQDPETCVVQFVKQPVVNGPIPEDTSYTRQDYLRFKS